MASPFDSRYRAIFKRSLVPTLVPRGFRAVGRRYVRELDGVFHVVEPDKGTLHVKDRSELTLYFGVGVPGWAAAFRWPPRPGPSLRDCAIRGHVGFIGQHRYDSTQTLRTGDPPEVDERISGELRRQLEVEALPFLDRFRRPDDLIAWLAGETPPEDEGVQPAVRPLKLEYLGVLYLALGRPAEARRALDGAVEGAQGTRWEQGHRVMRARLLGEA